MGMHLPPELEAKALAMSGGGSCNSPSTPLGLSEKRFQELVIAYAKSQGWKVFHTHDSRKSARGFPDLVLAKTGRSVIFAELKREDGKVTESQQEWIEVLRQTGSRACVWRPGDWETIVKLLKQE